MLDITYPNAAKIIDSFGKISKVLLEETRVNVFISKISKTPIKPIIIEIGSASPSAVNDFSAWLSNKNNDEVFSFNGWMFSSSPSLTPFDHPVYDVWLVSCY